MTEYAKNGTLDDIIQNCISHNNKIDFTKKLNIIYGIASIMSYLHSLNYIHRDIKPLNILLDDQYRPILSDFGLSKLCSLDNNENTKIALGTPFYMAPEIADAAKIFI